MQRIERYGVIALVFLLVTIVAVSLWGEQRKAGGLFSFLRRDGKSARLDRLVSEAPQGELPAWQEPQTRDLGDRLLPMGGEADATPLEPAQNPPGPLVPSPITQPAVAEGESGIAPEQVPNQIQMPPQPQPQLELVPQGEQPKVAAPPKPSTYKVQKGDTLGQIAQRELGTVRRLPELLAANPKLDPRKLQEGQVIQLPVESAASAPTDAVAKAPQQPQAQLPIEPKKPQPSPTAPPSGRRYVVRAGDTLSRIAQRELGSAKRMQEILALNQGLDANKLISGRSLVLPADAAPSDSVPSSTQRVALADAKTQSAPVQSTPSRSKVR